MYIILLYNQCIVSYSVSFFEEFLKEHILQKISLFIQSLLKELYYPN